MRNGKILIIALLFIILVGCAASLALPAIRDRVMWRVDELRLRVFYTLNPPEEAVFTPDARLAAAVQATLTQVAAQVTPTLAPSATATTTPLPPDVPSPTPTPSPTPPPASALIENVPYIDQHYGFNNCAPSNLTMALKFWGWGGAREDVSQVVKPFEKDKNVMPYELVNFVNDQTRFRALERAGGTPELLKRMVAAGFPVIVERGVYLLDLSGKVSWMGHYQVVYGYDDTQAKWQVKDSFEKGGDHFVETYDELIKGWRSFNYTFLVVYPAEQEGQVMSLLGEYADDANANQIAARTAQSEISSTQGQDQFFAWYNRGTSLYRLQDFNGAAQAFDQAFQLNASLTGDQRPWRILWYETGPYFAYYYTGRYQDVVNLADKTISTASEPFIEESFYWRAMAKSRLGDTNGAVEDLQKSLEYHPNFGPSVALLQQLGAAQ